MPNLTGFDSECDRRDAIRQQLVHKCVDVVAQLIEENAATRTRAELAYLRIAVAETLIKSIRLEAWTALLAEEIADAEKKLDE